MIMRAIFATIEDLKSGAVSNIPHWKFVPDQNIESLVIDVMKKLRKSTREQKQKNLMH